MEHSRDDIVIQNGVIAVDRLKNRIDPVNGFSENSGGENAGNIQIAGHFSGKGKLAVTHIVLEMVDILLF